MGTIAFLRDVAVCRALFISLLVYGLFLLRQDDFSTLKMHSDIDDGSDIDVRLRGEVTLPRSYRSHVSNNGSGIDTRFIDFECSDSEYSYYEPTWPDDSVFEPITFVKQNRNTFVRIHDRESGKVIEQALWTTPKWTVYGSDGKEVSLRDRFESGPYYRSKRGDSSRRGASRTSQSALSRIDLWGNHSTQSGCRRNTSAQSGAEWNTNDNDPWGSPFASDGPIHPQAAFATPKHTPSREHSQQTRPESVHGWDNATRASMKLPSAHSSAGHSYYAGSQSQRSQGNARRNAPPAAPWLTVQYQPPPGMALLATPAGKFAQFSQGYDTSMLANTYPERHGEKKFAPPAWANNKWKARTYQNASQGSRRSGRRSSPLAKDEPMMSGALQSNRQQNEFLQTNDRRTNSRNSNVGRSQSHLRSPKMPPDTYPGGWQLPALPVRPERPWSPGQSSVRPWDSVSLASVPVSQREGIARRQAEEWAAQAARERSGQKSERASPSSGKSAHTTSDRSHRSKSREPSAETRKHTRASRPSQGPPSSWKGGEGESTPSSNRWSFSLSSRQSDSRKSRQSNQPSDKDDGW